MQTNVGSEARLTVVTKPAIESARERQLVDWLARMQLKRWRREAAEKEARDGKAN